MADFVTTNIGNVAYAVSYLATTVQDAHGYIILQSGKNGGESKVSVSVVFDNADRFALKGVSKLESADDFEKLDIPEDVASFLAEIPFKGEDKLREIIYRFSPEEMNESEWADEAYVQLRRGADSTKYGYDIGGGLEFSVEVSRKVVGTIVSFSIR